MNKKVNALVIVLLVVIGGIAVAMLLQNNNSDTIQDNKQKISETTNNNNQVINNNNENKETQNNINNVSTENQKALVLYFSATGTTEGVAKKIGGVTNADIVEIEPKEKYSTADLNYNNDDCRANKEQNDKNARPEIANKINIEDYDTIYLGYPIWWGTAPRIIFTLLDNYDFSGKTVIPFCTSGGSGISQSTKDLKDYNKNINWLEGRKFNSSVSNSDIERWINENKTNGKEKFINIESEEVSMNSIIIKVNNEVLNVKLENNSSSKAFIEKLKSGEIVVNANDYGNFEKVGNLGFKLPTNDTKITTTSGDLILYQGDKITLYYDTNTWNFTRIGKVQNKTQKELKEILGNGDVTLTFSLSK